MKKILLSVATIAFFTNLNAQISTDKIVLAKNETLKYSITVKGSITQEMMGQSMEIPIDGLTNCNLKTTNTTATGYSVDFTTTRVKINTSIMGQDKNFDSEVKADMDGEMKSAGKNINIVKPKTLSFLGYCTSASNAEIDNEKADPMDNMMKQMMGAGSDEVTVESFFSLIPTAKKVGDTWVDSSSNESSKTVRNYKWESTDKNIALLTVVTKTTTETKTEMQGMEMEIAINNVLTETRKVDATTGIVKSKIGEAKITGTIGVQGMSVPLTGTMNSTMTAE
jgi:Family of unknown function (DUF6263)